MKLVGDALSSVQSAETTLAIASWGVVHGRSSLRQTEKLPRSCTLMFDGAGKDTMAWLNHRKVSLHDALSETFSKFGAVVGVTYLRCYPQTPAHPKGQVVQVLPGETEPDVLETRRRSSDSRSSANKDLWKYFGYISFSEPAEATAALELQKIAVLGRSIHLNTRVVQRNGGSGRLHQDTVDSGDYLNAQLEKRGLQVHTDQILASRGSVAWPFVYDGKRDVYREGRAGAQLNPNHSHVSAQSISTITH